MNLSIKDRMALRAEDSDRGDLVQTVLLIAGFAVVAILIVTWLGTAILNKGSDAASCIQNADANPATTYHTEGYYDSAHPVANPKDNGCNENAASSHGFQSDSGYKNRFGNN